VESHTEAVEAEPRKEATPQLRGRLPVVVGIAAAGVVLADSLRLVGIQGPATLGILGVALLTFLNAAAPTKLVAEGVHEPRPTRLMPPAWLTLFMCWVMVMAVAKPIPSQGFQNLAVYAVFFTSIPAAAAATTPKTSIRVLKAFRAAGVVVAIAYLALVAVGGPGTELFYGARAVAGSLLTAIAILVAMRAVLRVPAWPLYLTIAALGLSLSRAALAIAFVLMMTLAVQGKRGAALFRAIGLGGLISAGVLLMYRYYEPFRNRFEVGDDYAVGGVTIGSSGRAALWEETTRHWQTSAWFGHGVGSAEEHTLLMFRTIEHPHNDYLRLLHDFGIVGLALWVLAIVALMRGAYLRYRASDGADRAIHLAALLLLIKLVLFMIANNPVVGVFGMLATGAVVGVSIGRNAPSPRAESRRSPRRLDATPGVGSRAGSLG
jgi:O-antigen ligase